MDLTIQPFDFFQIQTSLNGLDTLLRLAVALVCSGAIGMERGRHNQAAGLRTHILIAVASCVIMEAGILLAGPGGKGGDPARMAAQVVSGIGFLGAGAIFRFGIDIKGLTTAASVWAVSAIGLAVGGGMYFLGIAGTLFLLFVLHVLEPMSRSLSPRLEFYTLRISGKDVHLQLGVLREIVQNWGAALEKLSVSRQAETHQATLSCHITAPPVFDPVVFLEEVQNLKGTESVTLDSLQ